jgi:hypothetical protein
VLCLKGRLARCSPTERVKRLLIFEGTWADG